VGRQVVPQAWNNGAVMRPRLSKEGNTLAKVRITLAHGVSQG
jgi:hypothetical protein